MKRSTVLALVTATAALSAIPAVEALACGACFVPPASSTVVSGHRMVLAISPQRTVLWDQIQYQGDPAEFAWVLPIKPGAVIETSTAAFFEVLEASTQRQVQGPTVNCGGGADFGCGFGSDALAAGGDFESDGTGGGSGNPVTVVHQGTVGPYETVTLHSTEPGALNAWLTTHNFNVDASAQPVIDQYVAEGFDFIALRLQPGVGVSQMTPVRVVTPGASPAMPLRMVAIGTGATVPIVLYVIGEGRWTTQNFPEVFVDEGLVTWDYKTSTSNYADLRDIALSKDGGRGFLTAYARKGLLTETIGYDYETYTSQEFTETYFEQARENGESSGGCGAGTLPTRGLVVDSCTEEGCPSLPAGQVDVSALTCNEADDVAAATLGMHLEDVWVTRLESVLPQAALDTDLVLKASDQQEPVERTVYATLSKNGELACGAAFVPVTIGNADPPSGKVGWWILAALGATGAMLVARRNRVVASPRPAR